MTIDDPAEASDQQYGRREDDELAQKWREFDIGWTDQISDATWTGDDDPDE